jgi:cytochrome P450
MASEARVSRDALRDDFEAVFDGLAREGDLVWVTAGKQRFLLVNEPEAVSEVLVQKADVLVKPRSQAIDTGPLRPEPVDATVDVAALRRGATAGLAAREQAAAETARAAAAAEKKTWSDGMQVELMPALRRIAIRIAVEGAFASRLDAGAEARLQQVLRWLDDAPRVLPVGRLNRHGLRRPQMLQLLAGVAAELVANAEHGGELEALAGVPERARLPVAGELLLGAVGPLVQTAGWLLVRFAGDPEEAARLRAEWPAAGRTTAFVREVTRLHPTNPRITRAALADTTVAGERVPAHTRVVLNVNSISRDPRFYDDPERLDPARWLGGRPHKFAYLAFGVGERRCLGEAFALASLAALLPALAEGWSFAFPELAEASRGRRQLAEGLRVTVSVC